VAGSVPTLLTSGVVNTASAVTTTASVTPPAGSCLIVAVYAHAAGVFGASAISGCSMTWVELGTIKDAAVGNEILTVFAGYAAAPTAGTIAITLSQTPAGGRYVVIQSKEAATASNPATSNIVTSRAASGTAGTNPFTTFIDGAQLLFSFWGHRINEVASPDAEWSELSDAGTTTAALEAQYDACSGDLNPSASWATTSSWLAVAVEMKKSVYAMKSFGSAGAAGIEVHKNTPEVIFEGDEEGPTVAGKPSGMWAILGGPGT